MLSFTPQIALTRPKILMVQNSHHGTSITAGLIPTKTKVVGLMKEGKHTF